VDLFLKPNSFSNFLQVPKPKPRLRWLGIILEGKLPKKGTKPKAFFGGRRITEITLLPNFKAFLVLKWLFGLGRQVTSKVLIPQGGIPI